MQEKQWLADGQTKPKANASIQQSVDGQVE